MDSAFASVAKELLNISSKKPLILVLEDIHWADSASLSLLHYIARLVNLERILVLATYRSEALGSNSEGHPSILMQTVRGMGRDDLYEELKLSGLNQVEIGKLATSMLGGNLQNEFLKKLSTESQGNPLFIVESLRMLINEGVLIRQGSQWRPTNDRIIVPSKVKDIILQRLTPLKLEQRKILDVASVLGEKFDAKLIASVLNQEQIQILEQLNNIAHSTALVKWEGTSYSFDHAKSMEILYDELPVPLRVGYHLKIAEKLESLLVEKTGAATDLAYHYEKAGNKKKTILYSLLAGKDALAKFSNLEAKRHFSYVLNITDPDNPSYERIEALEGLGDAFFNDGEFKKAQIKFDELMKNTGDGVIKLRALRKAMATARWLGDFSHALQLSQEAEPLWSVDKLEYARILLIKGAALGSSGNPKDALESLEKSISIFEDNSSLNDLAQALNESASLYQTQGYPKKAVSIVKRAIALNKEIGDLRGLVDAYFYAGQIFFNYRLTNEALSCFTKAAEIAEKIGYSNRIAWANLYSAIVLGKF